MPRSSCRKVRSFVDTLRPGGIKKLNPSNLRRGSCLFYDTKRDESLRQLRGQDAPSLRFHDAEDETGKRTKCFIQVASIIERMFIVVMETRGNFGEGNYFKLTVIKDISKNTSWDKFLRIDSRIA